MTTGTNIDNSFEYAAQLFYKITDDLDDCGHDQACVIYALWIELTRELIGQGWTTEELLSDCGRHAADQESASRA